VAEHDDVVALGGLHIMAQNVTKPGGSTISSAGVQGVKAIRAHRAFISPLKTIYSVSLALSGYQASWPNSAWKRISRSNIR
jgi:hypothetical protein